MLSTGTSEIRHGATKRSSKVTMAALAGVCLFSFVGIQVTGAEAAGTATQTPTKSGFIKPFSGVQRFVHLAPTQLTNSGQLNQPIGQQKADEIARAIRLRKSDAFTQKQFRLFVTGKGVGGIPADAKLVDQSVRILTNTVGRPLYSKINGKLVPSVLASYGLMVNESGLLESPANTDAPTRQVNSVIEPGGYLGTWCKANGATASLRRLYASAYTVEAVYGNKSQLDSGVAQLVTNKKEGHASSQVGMSMVPSIWLVNFALIYTLNPSLAAKMPASWAPIPRRVANAITASPTGQVPYAQYASALR